MSESYQNRFTRAYPEPLGHGLIKQSPEDFKVDEELSFPLTGEGEHVYLKIRKTGTNTMWVLDSLARNFSVKPRDIGYAGLKDRHAVTTQWFSVPAKAVDSDKLEIYQEDGVEILDTQRHRGKLRQGAIRHNRFRIIVSELVADEKLIQQRLKQVKKSGVPNYFDEQRFGRQRQNLLAADKLFCGELKAKKAKRRIYLSAARAWLFNLILAERVTSHCWSTGLDGDVFMLEGSKRFFHEERFTDELAQRLAVNDIHPTAPLWGAGDLQSSAAAEDMELRVLAGWPDWCRELEKAGMKQQRRATRVVPGNLEYEYDPVMKNLTLCFELPAGSYATNLLRELVSLDS